MSYKQHTGRMIQQMREHRGMSQTELANKLGRKQHHISEIENGHRGFSIDSLVSIANALNCNLDIMLTPRE